MRRVGILGGTFDPPHLGHLVLAEYAQQSLGLERVLFVPAADPPHKRGAVRTPISYRLPMLELAIADQAYFAVSRIDIDRPGPHFAVDMIRLLQIDLPDAELYFLMGSDSFSDLPRWHQPEALVRLCRIVVLDRPGRAWALDMHADTLPDLASRTSIISYPRLGISSTEVSTRLHAGQSVRYLVPQPVLDFISEHGLYKHAHEQTAP